MFCVSRPPPSLPRGFIIDKIKSCQSSGASRRGTESAAAVTANQKLSLRRHLPPQFGPFLPVPELSPVTRHRIGFLYLFEAPPPPWKGVFWSQKGHAEGFGVCTAASELAEGRGDGAAAIPPHRAAAEGGGRQRDTSPEVPGARGQRKAEPSAAWDTGASYLSPRTQKKNHYLGCRRWGLRRDEPPLCHRNPAVPPQDTDDSDSRAFTLGSTTGWSDADWGGSRSRSVSPYFGRSRFFPPLLGCL